MIGILLLLFLLLTVAGILVLALWCRNIDDRIDRMEADEQGIIKREERKRRKLYPYSDMKPMGMSCNNVDRET